MLFLNCNTLYSVYHSRLHQRVVPVNKYYYYTNSKTNLLLIPHHSTPIEARGTHVGLEREYQKAGPTPESLGKQSQSVTAKKSLSKSSQPLEEPEKSRKTRGAACNRKTRASKGKLAPFLPSECACASTAPSS